MLGKKVSLRGFQSITRYTIIDEKIEYEQIMYTSNRRLGICAYHAMERKVRIASFGCSRLYLCTSIHTYQNALTEDDTDVAELIDLVDDVDMAIFFIRATAPKVAGCSVPTWATKQV